ncbi:TIGR01777 family oxidoreductase [Bdellovibrio sp. HCB274]|uniref:TIGR01777 family oxidoreductase n=1 Tax=Bdellovibrio sp. HCB274 TaxID=3394361 RepID=UPI0039B4A608
MKVLITGATGLIGKELGKKLATDGHEITVISRSLSKAREQLPFPCEVVVGDLVQGPIHDKKLENIEAVINLMGEPVLGTRWSEEKKKAIFQSRVNATENLVKSIPSDLRVFVGGTAIGIYGHCGETILHEDHAPGMDFLSEVSKEWERASSHAPGRKVFIRTSIVLARHGGALDEMLFPFRAGVGGVLGDGKHWMSWIHIDDIVGLFAEALVNNDYVGPINGCSPHPVMNREFSEVLAFSLGKKLGPAVPPLALKALFGEASEVVLSSIRGSAEKGMSLGYRFQYPTLRNALEDICASYKEGEEVFYSEQFIQKPPEEIFPFFRDPHNLESITPPSLNFNIQSTSTPEIEQGTLINYKLKIRGIPATWLTEIDEWKPPFRFVDNQKKGPYQLWHHTHEFKPFLGGTLMIDRVRYRLPLGYLGWLTASKFVRKDVEEIFKFRRSYIARMDTPRKP